MSLPVQNGRLASVIVAVTALILVAGVAADDADGLDVYFDAPYDKEYEQTMVARIRGQINRYLDRLNDRVAAERHVYWHRDHSSWSAYSKSVEPNRQRLQRILGVVDERVLAAMEQFGPIDAKPPAVLAETQNCTIQQVRWEVFDGIRGEGLLLTPKQRPIANVVALPDADQTPAELAGLAATSVQPFALRLAERGMRVIVPTLISRDSTFSGTPDAIPNRHWQEASGTLHAAWTDMTHREWTYRQAYVMGRHVVGYEIQKTLSAVDWFEGQEPELPIGVAGYGEGGLIAFYAAAIDQRITSTLVSGYFGPREKLHEEPVERNVWGLLTEFGDAEIASLIAPRALTVEYSTAPPLTLPVPRTELRAATGGRWETPTFAAVAGEVRRIDTLFSDELTPLVTLVHGVNRDTVKAGSPDALKAFSRPLGLREAAVASTESPQSQFLPDADARQQRQVDAISRRLMEDLHDLAEFRRYKYFAGDDSSAENWVNSTRKYRDYFYEEVVGRLPDSLQPLKIQQRQVFDEQHWTGYETILDVLPGVIGWGLLAVPKDLKPGERRPVVVVQHGHAGTPTTPWRTRSYNQILPKLCQRGFIVFAPFAPYQFDVRRATPLKASVYSVLIPLHQQIVRWLATLKQVDAGRIGFLLY